MKHTTVLAGIHSLRISSTPRCLVASVIVILLAACGAPPDQEASQPPNIVLVITDDQGWSQVGWRGNDVIETPNLDRLATQSV